VPSVVADPHAGGAGCIQFGAPRADIKLARARRCNA
jgi:hypothetical protein